MVWDISLLLEHKTIFYMIYNLKINLDYMVIKKHKYTINSPITELFLVSCIYAKLLMILAIFSLAISRSFSVCAAVIDALNIAFPTGTTGGNTA